MKEERESRKNQDLKDRTKQFALGVIRLYSSLPKTSIAQTIGNQLLRSGTSVGANYREGCRARSNAEFTSKINISLQELEETVYWLELLSESKIIDRTSIEQIQDEANQLIAIFITIIKKVREQ